MLKYIYYLIISLVLVVIQQSILPVFNLTGNLNLLLVFVVFVTLIFGFNLGFIFAVFIGFISNIYSFLPFGTLIISYIIVLFVINYLYKNVLISFSFLATFSLIIIATILFNLLILLLAYIFYHINLIDIYISADRQYWENLLSQLILNTLVMILGYIIAKTTIKKLNLAFITKS